MEKYIHRRIMYPSIYFFVNLFLSFSFMQYQLLIRFYYNFRINMIIYKGILLENSGSWVDGDFTTPIVTDFFKSISA